MTYTLEIRPLAVLEIIEAYDWYELKKENLGAEFINEFENFNSKLLSNPYIHSFYDEPIRQGALDRFPYTVVYEIFNDKVVIYSVFMDKRNPSQKRIK